MSAFYSGLTGIPSLAGGSPSRLVLAVLLCTAYDANVRELLVDRLPVVVEAGRLEDDARRAHHHRHREDPQEQAVQHHRHVLPVLFSLSHKKWIVNSSKRSATLRTVLMRHLRQSKYAANMITIDSQVYAVNSYIKVHIFSLFVKLKIFN